MKKLDFIVSIFLVQLIFLCLFTSFWLINPFSAAIQSFASLLIFNILFSSLFFLIEGKGNWKLSLLTLGNLIGLCWNLVFTSLSLAGTVSFGSTFNHLSLIFFPFLSSLWIVSFWSLSITILRRNNFSRRN